MIRSQLFWLLDKLTGSKKKEAYFDVKTIAEQPNSYSNQQKRKTYLDSLLNHAANTTIFYKDYIGFKEFSSFPVVNKNIIKNNFSQFESLPYKTQKKIKVSTSGSTGTPFYIFQNNNKVLRNFVDNLYFSELAGYNLGNKLYYFRMWKAFEKKSVLTKLIQNIVPIDVFDLNENYLQKLMINLNKNKNTKSWIGYASAFESICKYLDKINSKPINSNLKSVIAISESLNSYTKNAMKTYFNVNIVSRYSNVENGILAQQLPNTTYFVINEASYFIEILSINSDTPANKGNKGRIVITDLFNYCMPIIRYDTGDIGTIKNINGLNVLTCVEGRKIDAITNTKGEIIASNLVLLINNYPELNQFQIIQKSDKKYVFKINIEGEFKNKNRLVSEFKFHLGEDAIIEIVYVDEIPLLASGKRRVMINENI